MSSPFDDPPTLTSQSDSSQLSGSSFEDHHLYNDPLRPGEFVQPWETELFLQMSNGDNKVPGQISLSRFQAMDDKTREYYVSLYCVLSNEEDVIIVRCNKLPRVFIGARTYFDSHVKYIAVAGDLPIIVDNDSPLFPTLNVVPSTGTAAGGQVYDDFSAGRIESAPGSPAAAAINGDDASTPAAPAAVPTTSSSRRAGRRTVARPPNCFIIFRQHLHPLVVRDNPGVHNNVISAIISKMWHAAPPMIIDQYKALADQAKAQHAALHPDYRYQPRKSSEKKRRMTKKKAAALELAAAQNGQQLGQAGGIFNAVLPTGSATRGEIVSHNFSTEIANNEPQGSGLALEMVDESSILQEDDFTATSDAFAPRDDFEVVITADYPDEIIVDPAVADANSVGALTDYTNQADFRNVYETINGDAGTPAGFQEWAVWSNEAYTFDPLPYDHDLHDPFFGKE
ncbi:hypothetical protein ONS96_001457 [Cadophora gregata f. sp. sojae]|nr:hypothetical protein ONS96_001457 [Cadophora gregata f. sp. sojae]